MAPEVAHGPGHPLEEALVGIVYQGKLLAGVPAESST